MSNKTVLAAAIIATMLATLSVAASEMANANNGELALKLMAFIPNAEVTATPSML